VAAIAVPIAFAFDFGGAAVGVADELRTRLRADFRWLVTGPAAR